MKNIPGEVRSVFAAFLTSWLFAAWAAGFSAAALDVPSGEAPQSRMIRVSADGAVPLSEGLPKSVCVSIAKSQAMRKALEQGGRAAANSETVTVNFELVRDVLTINAEGLLEEMRWTRFPENGGQDWLEEDGFVRVHLEANVSSTMVLDDLGAWEKLMRMRGQPRFLLQRIGMGSETVDGEKQRFRKYAFDAMESGLRKHGIRFQDDQLLKQLRSVVTDPEAGYIVPSESVLTSGEFPVDYMPCVSVELSPPRVRNQGGQSAKEFRYDVVLACYIVECSGGKLISDQKISRTLGPYYNYPRGGTSDSSDPEKALRRDIEILAEIIAEDTYSQIMRDWRRLDNMFTRIVVHDARMSEILLLEQEIRKNAGGDIVWRSDLGRDRKARIDLYSSLDSGTVLALLISQNAVPLNQRDVFRHGNEITLKIQRDSVPFLSEEGVSRAIEWLWEKPHRVYTGAGILAFALLFALVVFRSARRRK